MTEEEDLNFTKHPDDGIEQYQVWKPLRMDSAFLDLSKEEKKTQFLFRIFTSQLNKLTIDNCSTLMNKMKNLPIDTLTKMRRVVEILHKKAIDEQNFLALYAQVCEIMKDKQFVDGVGILKTFSSFMLAHCVKHFEISLTENLVYERKKLEIELIDCQETRKILLKEYLQEENQRIKRSVGNCTFIAELFKLKIIEKEVLFEIIDRLFKSAGNLAAECICAILTTVGKFYEEKFGEVPSMYFEKIEVLCKEDVDLVPRIRFLLQDLLDLKRNSWRLKNQQKFQDDRSDNFPIGLISRETFDSVVKEFINSDKSVGKSHPLKYTVEYLSSFRDLPQCNRPVTISSPQFARQIIYKRRKQTDNRRMNLSKRECIRDMSACERRNPDRNMFLKDKIPSMKNNRKQFQVIVEKRSPKKKNLCINVLDDDNQYKMVFKKVEDFLCSSGSF